MLSACLTINERPTPVLDAMFGSLADQPFDEMVIVFDRSPLEVVTHCRDYWKGMTGSSLAHQRAAGWRSPVPAWNRAFGMLTGDFLFAFSSEVVHAPQNVRVAYACWPRTPSRPSSEGVRVAADQRGGRSIGAMERRVISSWMPPIRAPSGSSGPGRWPTYGR